MSTVQAGQPPVCPPDELGGQTGIARIVTSNETAAVCATGFEAFSNGVRFAIRVHLSIQPSDPTSLLKSLLGSTRNPTGLVVEPRAQLGRTRTAGPVGAQTLGSDFHSGVVSGVFFISPFPSDGIEIAAAWPEIELPARTEIVDGDELAAARQRVVRLFPSPSPGAGSTRR